MTREDLIKRMQQRCPSFTQGQLDAVVDEFLDILMERLACGDGIMFRGFGTFSTRDKPESRYFPALGGSGVKPACRVISFKPHAAMQTLADAVMNGSITVENGVWRSQSPQNPSAG